MTTVGYGDVRPVNRNEMIYSMIIMILACAIFAYIIGSIGGAIAKQFQEETEHKKQTVNINRYMRRNKIPFDV